ncbi:MAG TPA: enoyl-CoA hydratase/isomerase family protein [Tepidiformaceae bacterium]|nr:enoyl-CoA hydratase/isomerase family protein [Tepidiformaceae bacterium]
MSSPEPAAVLFEVADGVATITPNRPYQMNAINGDLSTGLMDALREVRSRDDIRVAILTGAGRAFCAGADLRSRAGGPAAAGGIGALFSTAEAAGFADFDLRKPLIGAVNGFCLGGGFEIALTCDILIASEAAQFGLPEITLGFFPLAGAPVRLPRSIPRVMANDMLFTGERIDARTALAFGIVSRVVPADTLAETARTMAGKIAGYAPLAVRSMRELVRRQGDMPHDDAMRLAGTMRWIIGLTDDAKEGPRAFAEKRQPVFKGE